MSEYNTSAPLVATTHLIFSVVIANVSVGKAVRLYQRWVKTSR